MLATRKELSGLKATSLKENEQNFTGTAFLNR